MWATVGRQFLLVGMPASIYALLACISRWGHTQPHLTRVPCMWLPALLLADLSHSPSPQLMHIQHPFLPPHSHTPAPPPPCLQVPFGTFEEVLKQRPNEGVRRQLEEVVRSVTPANAHEKLAVCRDLAMQVGWAAFVVGGSGGLSRLVQGRRGRGIIRRAGRSSALLLIQTAQRRVASGVRPAARAAHAALRAGHRAARAPGGAEDRDVAGRHPGAARLGPLGHGHGGAQGALLLGWVVAGIVAGVVTVLEVAQGARLRLQDGAVILVVVLGVLVDFEEAGKSAGFVPRCSEAG